MPTLKFIKLDLPKDPLHSRENGEAMTAGLSRKGVALTDPRLASPVNGTIIARISQIETLECLRIAIPLTPLKDWGTLRLNLLTQLPALRALHIDQETDPDDANEARIFPKYDKELQYYVSLKSKLEHLLDPRVRANASAQTMLPIDLRSKNLKNLELEIIPDVLPVNTQMFVLPSVLAIYAKRNTTEYPDCVRCH